MDSSKFTQAILEAERVGLLLYVVVIIIGAVLSFGALSATDWMGAFAAGVTVVSGVVVLGIIAYLETQVWDSE